MNRLNSIIIQIIFLYSNDKPHLFCFFFYLKKILWIHLFIQLCGSESKLFTNVVTFVAEPQNAFPQIHILYA